MKITHDKIADALYITLKKGPVAHTIKAKKNIIIDTDKDGLIVGIEILNASTTISNFVSPKKKTKLAALA